MDISIKFLECCNAWVNGERTELSKITVPTLVICGRSDIIKESHTKEIVIREDSGQRL